ncbi:MAG: SRPBCC family protein [Actinocrinis sp.]
MSEPSTIRVDQFLAHPPARVWTALTDSDQLARWLMPNTFRLVAGHRFTFRTEPVPAHGFDGVISCQVLDFAAPRLLRISWRGASLDTVVTWTLQAEGKGTRLFLEHSGFDPHDPTHQLTRKILDGGWRSHVMRALERCLDQSA